MGGGYGGKISLPNRVAAATAVAANKLGKPVRLVLDIETNMRMMGKRLPYLCQYKVSLYMMKREKRKECRNLRFRPPSPPLAS